MPWSQVYDPLGAALFSTVLAALPIVVLLGALGLLDWPAPRAAFAGLVTALGVAILIFGMPWRTAVAAAGFGAAFGLFPIGWIVLGAVFLYSLTVETGEFEKVKWSVASRFRASHRFSRIHRKERQPSSKGWTHTPKNCEFRTLSDRDPRDFGGTWMTVSW